MSLADNSRPAPNSRTLDWASFVRAAWGDAFNEPDVVYRESNGREFKSTDGSTSGIYGIDAPTYLLAESSRAGLDPDYIMTESGLRIRNG